MRRIVLIIVVAAAIAGGVYYWKNRADAAPPSALAETSPVAVARGTLLQSIASTGRVVSNLDVDIKCKASGKVDKVPKDISDSVKQGDLLLQIDPIDEQRAVDLATVALDQSKAKLEQAIKNLEIARQNLVNSRNRIDANLKSAQIKARDNRLKADRRRDLLEQKLGTQEEYDSALTLAAQAEAELQSLQIQQEELKSQELGIKVKEQDVKLAEAEVKSDEIALANSRQRLADTQVYAPIDGTVSDRKVQIGTIISSGITNVGGGTTILTLSDLSHMYVLAAVDESDIGQVKLDQPVNITVDAYPGMMFKGKVVRIATKGVNTSNVVTFEVKIEVLSPNKDLLKPEMTANVQIVAAERKDVLLVPSQAISRKGDQLVATVSTPTGTEDRPVKMGLNDGTHWEVVSGLEEGQTVMVRKGEADSRWRADGPPRMPVMMGGGGGMRGPGGGGGRGGR